MVLLVVFLLYYCPIAIARIYTHKTKRYSRILSLQKKRDRKHHARTYKRLCKAVEKHNNNNNHLDCDLLRYCCFCCCCCCRYYHSVLWMRVRTPFRSRMLLCATHRHIANLRCVLFLPLISYLRSAHCL